MAEGVCPHVTESVSPHINTLVFRKYFPTAQIDIVGSELIPQGVMDFFEHMSCLFIKMEDHRPGNFEALFVIEHDSGDRTFVAQQTKTYSTNGDTEQLTYFVDTNSDDAVIGKSEMRRNISNKSDYYKDKPFVGSIYTLENYRKRGLGTRRLIVMNAVSQMLYGLALHSSTVVSDLAAAVWTRLVREGKARVYKEGVHDRFAFSPDE